MKRIGLLGGSFNPPQLGHLSMAKNLHRFAGCDEVWLLVTPNNPFKDPEGYASLADRMHMCELMAEGRPWLKVSDIEREFGCIRTFETLANLRQHFPGDQFIWSMGGDNLLEFHRWEGWEEIISHHPIVVFGRPGADGVMDSVAMRAAEKSGFTLKDATHISEGATGFLFCNNKLMDVSSTRIRHALIHQRDICPHGISQAVYDYIIDRSLFAGRPQQVTKPLKGHNNILPG